MSGIWEALRKEMEVRGGEPIDLLPFCSFRERTGEKKEGVREGGIISPPQQEKE